MPEPLPGGHTSQAVLAALGNGLFAVLSDDERLALARRARLRAFAGGDVLFREGQESVDPAFLLSGLVKLSRSAARGRECVLHLVRPGRMLDAGVLFYEGGLPATAVGVKEGRLLWLDKSALLTALRGNAALGLGLIAAALVTGLAGIGGGMAVAAGAPAAIAAASEDPKSFGKSLIFVALGESIALYGVVISILILNKLV